jgi:hypothetical protein
VLLAKKIGAAKRRMTRPGAVVGFVAVTGVRSPLSMPARLRTSTGGPTG